MEGCVASSGRLMNIPFTLPTFLTPGFVKLKIPIMVPSGRRCTCSLFLLHPPPPLLPISGHTSLPTKRGPCCVWFGRMGARYLRNSNPQAVVTAITRELLFGFPSTAQGGSFSSSPANLIHADSLFSRIRLALSLK